MTEERAPYPAGHAATPEPSLTTEALIAKAHARHQGIPYEIGEPWLARLPERLRALADLILSDKRTAGEVAHALAALIDRIENAPVNRDYNMYLIDPLNPLKNQ